VRDQLRRVYEVIEDIFVRARGKARREFLTDSLGKITGLATKDKLHHVKHFLEKLETGIYETAKFLSEETNSLVAAYKLEQDRLNNAFEILGEFRATIREIQSKFVQTWFIKSRSERYLQTLMMLFLSNNIIEMAEIDALYNAVKALMSGEISHFILSHRTLGDALRRV